MPSGMLTWIKRKIALHDLNIGLQVTCIIGLLICVDGRVFFICRNLRYKRCWAIVLRLTSLGPNVHMASGFLRTSSNGPENI